jgi:hypothetical protein
MVEYGDVEGLARCITNYLGKGLPAGFAQSLINKLKWDTLANEMTSFYQKLLSTAASKD